MKNLNTANDMPQVYLAGFGGHLDDCIARGDYLKSVCAKYGLKGVNSFDNLIQTGLELNRDMILHSDAILVNLTLLRGAELDYGTIFEMAVAYDLGKPVWAYIENGDQEKETVEDGGDLNSLKLDCYWAGKSSTLDDAAKCLSQHLLNIMA